MVVVRGTDKTIPIGPKTHPQKINDRKTIKVESPKPRPKNRGSRKLPIVKLIVIYPIIVIIEGRRPN